MISLLVVLGILGILLLVVCTGALVLLDPIIGILIIIGIYKLIRKIIGKKDKKKTKKKSTK